MVNTPAWIEIGGLLLAVGGVYLTWGIGPGLIAAGGLILLVGILLEVGSHAP